MPLSCGWDGYAAFMSYETGTLTSSGSSGQGWRDASDETGHHQILVMRQTGNPWQRGSTVSRHACARGTMTGAGFVTSEQWTNGLRPVRSAGGRETMSADTDATRAAAEDAAVAPLDLLMTDAATGMLRRLNPGGSGLRLAAALAVKPWLVAGRGTRLAGELARIAVGRSQVQPSRRDRRFADPGW